MGKREDYFALAEKYFVENQLPVSTISGKLNINVKTLHKWKFEGDWEKKRKQFLSSQYNCYSSLYELLNTVTTQTLDEYKTTGELPDKATLDFIKAMTDKLPKMKKLENELVQDKQIEAAEDSSPKDLNAAVIENISKYLKGEA